MVRDVAPRRLVVVRGTEEETARAARALLARFADVAFVDERSAAALLGHTRDAVVLSLHAGASADAIGRAHGVVRAGGVLVLCVPRDDRFPPRAALAVHPYTVDDVGGRFAARLMRRLAEHALDGASGALSPPPPDAPRGSAEQASVVLALAQAFIARAPSLHVVLARRGRGKSSALGLAIARALAHVAPDDVIVTGPSAAACEEVLSRAPGVGFVDVESLVDDEGRSEPRVLVVDEAAQLALPTLRALVRRCPRAHIALATTTQGYEGTGRGFALRFLAWLEQDARPLTVHTLRAPIRFAEDDPLERAVEDALLLARDDDRDVGARVSRGDALVVETLDRDALADDEPLLARTFALLRDAHHRTTPSDLERLLDAPNLSVHVARQAGEVLGACLVAREGGFDDDESRALATGARRVRGHALADTLLTHAARVDAGPLTMARSVRIVTDPRCRRAGVARALVEHVHAHFPDVELFGTLFGAAIDLVRFRLSQGYVPVRVGIAPGPRSGEPAITMARGVSAHARALVDELALDLARDLPHLRALVPLDDDLARVVTSALPRATPLDDEAVRARVRAYLAGPQPFEGAAHAITTFVDARRDTLHVLDADSRAVVVGRVLEQRSWRAVGRAVGGVPRAMRLLRPAIAQLFAGKA